MDLEEQEEIGIEQRYMNRPDQTHLLVRFYCYKCRRELQTKKCCIWIKLENRQILQIDIKNVCPKHPDAGFYALFLNS